MQAQDYQKIYLTTLQTDKLEKPHNYLKDYGKKFMKIKLYQKWALGCTVLEQKRKTGRKMAKNATDLPNKKRTSQN